MSPLSSNVRSPRVGSIHSTESREEILYADASRFSQTRDYVVRQSIRPSPSRTFD